MSIYRNIITCIQKEKKRAFVLAVALLCIVAIPVTPLCTSTTVGATRSHGTHGDEYLLVAPYRVNKNPGIISTGVVHLLDRKGNVVHTWKTEAPVLLARLQNDGTLVVSMTPPLDHTTEPGFGTTGIIQKLSWSGEVLWEHRDPLMTIGFDVLPDGSIAYLRWEKTPLWFSRAVSTHVEQVWANELVVVNKEGEESMVWKVSDHVSPYVSLDEVVPRRDFSHGNSVQYVADNESFGVPVFVMSFRHLSMVMIINATTGEVLWQSPEDLYAFQHDATLLQEGTMLAFDNGFAREGIHALFSRALEVKLPEGELLWQYAGGSTFTGAALLASSIMGSAERLSNGNTLITVSTTGRVYEVTREGQVVWEYAHMDRDTDLEPFILFGVSAYDGTATSWGARLLPSAFISSYCSLY